MIAAASIAEFIAAPVGRCVFGKSYVVWCRDPGLSGTALWGRPDQAEAEQLIRIWDGLRPSLRVPYDLITDGRRLAGVDADAFAVMEGFLQRVLPEYARRVGRHAIVHAAGLAGAALAGFYPLLSPRHSWRTFSDLRAAVGWLSRGDGEEIGAAHEALLARGVGLQPSVRGLRDQLARNLRGATLAGSARALSLSSRSLQRQLRQAGTSFRIELDRARVQAATALLLETTAKLETIAQRVGCSSAAHFSTLFRRLTGTSPSGLRERGRARA